MSSAGSGGNEEVTIAVGPQEQERSLQARLRLRLALQAKLIGRKAFDEADRLLEQDPAFDIRGYLETEAGMDPAAWVELERILVDLLESENGNTRKIGDQITEATQIADEFEKTFAVNAGAGALFDSPAPGAAEAETERAENQANAPFDFRLGAAGAGDRAGQPFDFSRYRPLITVGEGGEAVVFRAWDIELKRSVALKMVDILKFRKLGPAHQKFVCDRFVQEAHVTSRLIHPAVIPIYVLDYWPVEGTDLAHITGGIPFLVLPYYPNGDLSKEIRKLHPGPESPWIDKRKHELAFRGLIASIVRICRAVALAHERGFIHRDIKPKNVLIGHHGEVYLADWGLAKSILPEAGKPGSVSTPGSSGLSGSQETEGELYGTASYMSPEQANRQVHMHKEATDIFLIGSTLYALIYGRPPYVSENPIVSENRLEVYRMAEDCLIDFPAPLLPWADTSLVNICRRALAKAQNQRYSSATALAEDLERWMADQPLVHVTEAPRRKISRFLKRNSRSLATATLALLLGTVGMVIAYYKVKASRDTTKIALASESRALEKANELNRDLIVAKEQESQARELAENNFKLVSDQVIAQLDVISRKLPAVPGSARVRYEVAQELGSRVGTLAVQNPKNARLYWLWARVEREIGKAAGLLGDRAAAKRRNDRAIGIANGIARAYPKEAQYTIDVASFLIEAAILAQAEGEFERSDRLLGEAESKARSLQTIPPNPATVELLYIVLAQKCSLFADLGRNDEIKIILDQLADLDKTWYANLKVVKPQQFKFHLIARSLRAAHNLRAGRFDLAVDGYKSIIDTLEAQRQDPAKPFEPDYLLLLGDARHGLAESLRLKGDPASVAAAATHFEAAFETFAKLDRDAKGEEAYLDNLFWAYVDMRAFEAAHGHKFACLANAEWDAKNEGEILKKIDKMITESENPSKLALRAKLLGIMAARKMDKDERLKLARQADKDYETVLEKLPLRADFRKDQEELRKAFGL